MNPTADLRCPHCLEPALEVQDHEAPAADRWLCTACGTRYPEIDGIPLLIPPGSPLHPDNKKVLPRGALIRSTDVDLQAAYWEAHPGIRAVGHPVVAAFARQRWAHLGDRLALDGITTALDVGCGNGVGSVYAPPGVHCTGCDGSLPLLRQHPGAVLFGADAERLPFASDSFDLVFCWELLHHVEEPLRVIRELSRVARRYVVIFEPNPLNPAQFLFALADPEHRWVLRFRRRYLLDRVRKAGLACLVYQRCGWLFPNRTPGWLATLLLRLPFRVPFLGISQLVIARKDGAVSDP